MRNLLLPFLLMVVSQMISAQDIFQKHGFGKAPLSLSNGKYNEFFNNDKMVQIGTVLLDTQTNKVVAFVEEDSVQVKYLSDLDSRWLCIDPLAAKYPQVSPYIYCINNPLIYIDPNGMEFISDKDRDRAETSRNSARDMATTYTQQADALEKNENLTDEQKAQVKEYRTMASVMNQHADNLDKMITTTDMQFAYKEVNGDTHAFPDRKTGVIIIQYNTDIEGSQTHEEAHGAQFLNGEMTIMQKENGRYTTGNYDANDEAGAMKVQYSSMSSSGQQDFRNKKNVNGTDQINAQYLSTNSPYFKGAYPELVKSYLSSQK